MAEFIVSREGGLDALAAFMTQDAALLQEGESYRHVFWLREEAEAWASVIRAEVAGVVAALKVSGVEGVGGSYSGGLVVLNYRAGMNPLVILGGIMAIAWVTALFVVGYAIYRVVTVIPGVPWWVGVGAAALFVMALLPRARKVLTG